MINLLLAKIIYDKILDKYLTNEQEIHKNKLEDNEIIQKDNNEYNHNDNVIIYIYICICERERERNSY